jgi:hypothetical protein
MSCSRGCCPTQRDHYKSLVFGTPPAESDKFKGGYTKKFDADMDAYSRLRKDGLQPPRVDGSAELEKRANTREEVESDA